MKQLFITRDITKEEYDLLKKLADGLYQIVKSPNYQIVKSPNLKIHS